MSLTKGVACCQVIQQMSRPSPDWGPRLYKNRAERARLNMSASDQDVPIATIAYTAGLEFNPHQEVRAEAEQYPPPFLDPKSVILWWRPVCASETSVILGNWYSTHMNWKMCIDARSEFNSGKTVVNWYSTHVNWKMCIDLNLILEKLLWIYILHICIDARSEFNVIL